MLEQVGTHRILQIFDVSSSSFQKSLIFSNEFRPQAAVRGRRLPRGESVLYRVGGARAMPRPAAEAVSSRGSAGRARGGGRGNFARRSRPSNK